ncbi:MAG TPA: hypothetical protein VIJ19_02245 [Opitutaceae bacterium]
MKSIFLAGGFAGFALVAVDGFAQGRAPDRVLMDAAVGCLVGALLFRWFWTVLVRGIRETILIRHAAATTAASAKPKQS